MSYNSGINEGAGQSDQIATSGQPDLSGDRASDIRSEQDPGMLARDATSQDHIAYSPQQDGLNYKAPTGDEGPSSLNKALRGALPGAAAGGLAGAFQKPDKSDDPASQAKHAQEKAQLQRMQEQEEAKRRKIEQDSLKDKKKADFDRYREKIQSEMDEIEAEAEKYTEEEDDNL